MNSKDIQRLLHLDCKNASGGITSLAYTLGKSPNILGNKLNTECEQNHLSFQEAVELIAIVQSKKTVSAIAAQIDHLLVPIPHCTSSEKELLDGVLKLSAMAGRLCEEAGKSISPHSDLGSALSAKEKASLSKCLDDLIEKAICVKQILGQ